MDRIFRIGKVVKTSGSKIKVHFEDVNIESDWLKIVQICKKECGCLCNCKYNVGDYVLCAYNPGFNEQGFVLGGLS